MAVTRWPLSMPLTSDLPDPWPDLLRAWDTSLEAAGKSPHTRRIYRVHVMALLRFLLRQGMPTRPDLITREHVESYLNDYQRNHDPGSSSVIGIFASLRVCFGYLLEEGEITSHPMARMKRPSVRQKEVPVLADELVSRLLKACEGSSFNDRRDYAILRVLVDTPLRRRELANLRVADVDLSRRVLRVVAKGNKERTVPFGAKTAQALERYLRLRKQHPRAEAAGWWLGLQGPLGSTGLFLAIKRRAVAAGITERVWLHGFRHLFAHHWLAEGRQEESLMALGGWESREVMGKYARSLRLERAIEQYRQSSPGDRY